MEINKIILDLCGGTGAWSNPYRIAGYQVYNITLPKHDLTKEDILQYCTGLKPYGILCAIDCTIWANSGARWFKDRKPEEVFYHAKLLVHCLRIIYESNPVFWCIENPVGKMREFLGKPRLIFDPCEFGDPYTKKTYLWGKFNIPGFFKDASVKPTLGSKIHRIPPSKDRKIIRSITPEGFSQAFFEENK
jgi:hypothetical protein